MVLKGLAAAAMVVVAASLYLPAYASPPEPGPAPIPESLQPIVITARKSPVQRLIEIAPKLVFPRNF